MHIFRNEGVPHGVELRFQAQWDYSPTRCGTTVPTHVGVVHTPAPASGCTAFARRSAMRCIAMAVAALLSMGTARSQSALDVEGQYQQAASSVVSAYGNAIAMSSPRNMVQPDSMPALSPYIFHITSPGIYYSSPVADCFAIGREPDGVSPTTEGMDYRDALCGEVSNVLARMYADSPQLFQYTERQVQVERVIDANAVAQVKTEDLAPIYDAVTEIGDVADVVADVDLGFEVERPNFWTTSGTFSLQFTQNYFSENWYKGGNNNVTMLSSLVLEANYNDQRFIQWDNKLDMRLGFITATSDSCHKYLTSNDKIALYSKLGVKAAKYWNYALSVEANTQFMPGYKSNDRRKYSDFFAPLDAYISLGMDYKPQFSNNQNSLSLALLPLSYKMRYISTENETIRKAYNMVDKGFQQDFGSKLEFNSKLRIVDGLSWRCRLYYFTSYKYAESEMENALQFQFNKYISSEIYTLWRFDDNRAPQFYDDNLGFFQFKEYFTLGLSYKF